MSGEIKQKPSDYFGIKSKAIIFGNIVYLGCYHLH